MTPPLLFLKLGITGFGGPLATMAMMEEECVRKHKWLSLERFSELYTLCKLLPGPISTQLAIALGRELGGWKMGVKTGVSFTLPGFFLIVILAMLYAKTGIKSLPGVPEGLLAMQSAALGIIVLTAFNLMKPYARGARSLRSWMIFALALGLVFLFPRYEPLFIVLAGLTGLAGGTQNVPGTRLRAHFGTLFLLFWICFKAGAFVFGSGLAIVPLLEAELVSGTHLLSLGAFMDGLAMGQITPGPVVLTASFLGYLVADLPGALVTALGIFIPGYLIVLGILPPLMKRLGRGTGAQRFSQAAIPAVSGSILATIPKLYVGLLVSTTPLELPQFAPALLGVTVLLLSLKARAPGWLLVLGSGALVGVAGLIFR